MTYDHNNVFAKILRHEIKTSFILEDKYFASFNDLCPKAPIHVLVIPKGDYTDIYDFNAHANPQEIIGFYKGVSQTIKQLGLLEHGLRVISNMKDWGQQEVMHYHLHILSGKK